MNQAMRGRSWCNGFMRKAAEQILTRKGSGAFMVHAHTLQSVSMNETCLAGATYDAGRFGPRKTHIACFISSAGLLAANQIRPAARVSIADLPCLIE
jgi:hypothetical protein